MPETATDVTLHLWEPKHDYYGPEGSFWANWSQQGPYIQRHESWDDFLDDGMSQAIEGLNLLYRWDWHAHHIEYPEDYPDGATAFELELFWMMPRKGIMARSVIKVTPADEPAVRAWLDPHWAYMRGLWEPIATPVPTTNEGGTDG